ncbi:MAG: hypothetical protein H0X45_01805 [Planctomycetes bacterium]|nr:hypothetical protein [Planctomycetota bacterium]
MGVDYRQFIVDWQAFTRAATGTGSVIAALQVDEEPQADDDEDVAPLSPAVLADVTTAETAAGGLRELALVAIRHLRTAVGSEAFTDATSTLFWSSLDGEMTCELPGADDLQVDCVETILAPPSVELVAKAWADARLPARQAEIAAAAERVRSSRLTPAVFGKFLYDWKLALDTAVERRAGFVEMAYD